MTSTLRGGGGLTECRCSKGGCVDLVLWILPKCRQGGGGGPKSQKLCRRHLSMAPRWKQNRAFQRSHTSVKLVYMIRSFQNLVELLSTCTSIVQSIFGKIAQQVTKQSAIIQSAQQFCISLMPEQISYTTVVRFCQKLTELWKNMSSIIPPSFGKIESCMPTWAASNARTDFSK